MPRTQGGLIIVYCARCGAQNSEAARFCNYCGSPLDVKAAVPPGATAPPSPPPYAPPPGAYPAWGPRHRAEDECMGQTRVPGLVIFAVIILLVGVFGLIQWAVSQTTSNAVYSGVVWPLFGIALALVLIGVWALARPRAR